LQEPQKPWISCGGQVAAINFSGFDSPIDDGNWDDANDRRSEILVGCNDREMVE
jgi:hypothetical protein